MPCICSHRHLALITIADMLFRSVNVNRLIIKRNLRSAMFLLLFGTLFAFAGLLLYWNETGMPVIWREAIEKELSKQGVEAHIKKLRYVPLRGIEATEVEVFSDPSRTRRWAHLQRLVFDIDKSKALRGVIRLTHIDLENAELLLPVEPDRVDAELIHIRNLNGKVLLSRGRKFEIKQATGLIDGIRLQIDAVIYGFRPVPGYEEPQSESGKHRKFLIAFVKEVNQWRLDEESPPEISLKLEADATKWSGLKCDFHFSCLRANRGEIFLRNIQAQGNVTQSLISLHHLEADDQRGSIRLAMDYDLSMKSGNFDFDSSLDALLWYRSIVQKKWPFRISHSGPIRLQSRGKFSFPEEGSRMNLQMRGQIQMKNLLVEGQAIAGIQSDFAFQQGDFYLRKMHIEHDEGQCDGFVLRKQGKVRLKLKGQLPLRMLKPYYRDWRIAPGIRTLEDQGPLQVAGDFDLTMREADQLKMESMHIHGLQILHQRGRLDGDVRLDRDEIVYQLRSNAAAEVWSEFFPEQVLQKVLRDFDSNPKSQYDVDLNGKMDRKDPTKWSVNGKARVQNVSYRGIPVHHCRTAMELRRNHLLFSNIEVDFDYRDYRLRKIYGSGDHGPVQAREVRYDNEVGLVEIDALKGEIFPAPLLRMFAPGLAQSLEEYEFHVPPKLTASGKVDVRNQGNTNFQVQIIDAKAMNWTFLGAPVTIEMLSGDVAIKNQLVMLNSLKGSAFGGDLRGLLQFDVSQEKSFTADFSWNQLKLKAIAQTYQFNEQAKGMLTGKISLSGKSGKTETLQGQGQCVLEKGELFAVPMFGPLSTVVAFVLADRRVGFERAKYAACNFVIREGILRTDDFMTNTASLKFTGNGNVNLNDRTMDMTMRMNARGLLGLVVMPFQPIIKGLFQFKGQGPLGQPKWEHVIFTSPPKKEEEILLKTAP